MLINGEKIYISGKGFISGCVEISNGAIVSVSDKKSEAAVVSAYYVLPGFIDIHTHGAMGGDAHHADAQELVTIRKFMAAHGTTSFVPTTMTDSIDKIINAIENIVSVNENNNDGANIIGINIEGPYFTEKHKGAHLLEFLKKPDCDEFDEMVKAGKGLLSMICVAPEYDNAKMFIEHVVSKGVVASVAHNDASYERVKEAFSWGATNVTHLFNAMSPFQHRSPGCVGAAFDSDVTAEMICDGLHIHPAAVMMAIRQKGAKNIVLISDSLSATGLPDGKYKLGSQDIIVQGGKATIPAGNLAGSTTYVLQCFRNVISWGTKIEDAVIMASENPARVARADKKGKIETGYDADFTLLDDKLELDKTIIRGNIAFQR